MVTFQQIRAASRPLKWSIVCLTAGGSERSLSLDRKLPYRLDIAARTLGTMTLTTM